MQKALILVFIFALYAAGVEAAADYHGDMVGGGDSQPAGHHGLTDDHGDSQSPDAGDHCCHLAGHLLGIVSVHAAPAGCERSAQNARVAIHGYGRATTPPVPPPNIL